MDFYKRVGENLKKICEECKFNGTSQCIPSRCIIGFASNAIRTAKIKGQQTIEDGTKLIPQDDMKVYDENLIAKSIASVCALCKECKENHDENCIVSLVRRSLENTHLKEDIIYPGNILMYLVNVAEQDRAFSEKIRNEYTQIMEEYKKQLHIDKSVIFQKSPISVELKKSTTYYWCACGKSSSQPFCDGSHVGTSFSPLPFTAERNEAEAHICACKHTKNPPYCDGSHKNL